MESSNPAPRFPARPPIVPVIDIMGGRVVRAVGGRRDEYRPVRSVLTDSTEPGAVAKALVAATGAECVYVADLNGIVHGRPDLGSVLAVQSEGIAVVCDAGVRTREDVERLTGAGIDSVVVATETATPSILPGLHRERLVFSIDLQNGVILGDWRAWGVTGPGAVVELAGVAVRHDIERVLLLDLARVGTGTGSGTEHLVAACKNAHPKVNVLAGGGVRTWADVERLGAAGADGVLVASALHDGTLWG